MSPPTASPTNEFESYGVDEAGGPTPGGAPAPFSKDDASIAINYWLREAQKIGQSVVRLLPGRFVILNPVKLLDSVILEGSGPEVTEIAIGGDWKAKGPQNRDQRDAIAMDEDDPFSDSSPPLGPFPFAGRVSLTAAVLPRQDRLTVNLGGARALLPGEDPVVDGWHLLFSGEPFNHDPVHNPSYSQRMRGELVRVFSRDDATGEVVIEGMTRDAYFATATPSIAIGGEDVEGFLNAAMLPVRFATGCGVRNLAVTREARTAAGAPVAPRDGAGAAIHLKWVRRGVVENCHLHALDCAGVILQSCLHTRVQNCVIEDLLDDEPHDRFGYGVLLAHASESVVVTGNRIRRVRHGVDAGQLAAGDPLNRAEPVAAKRYHAGVPRGVIIASNVISGCTNGAISTHAQGAGVTVTGNVVSNTIGFAIEMRAPSSYVQGNTIEWCGGGIRVGNPQSPTNPVLNGAGTQVVSNVIRHVGKFSATWPPPDTGAPTGTGAGGAGTGIQLRGTDHVNVVGNTISDCFGPGIELKNLTARCVVANNVLTDVCQNGEKAGIELEAPSQGTEVANLIRGNVIFTTSPEGEHGIGDESAPTGQGGAVFGVYVRDNVTNTANIVVDNVSANMTAPSTEAVKFDVAPPWPRLDQDNPNFDN